MEEEVVELIQPPSLNKEEGLISSQTKKNKVSFYQKMEERKKGEKTKLGHCTHNKEYSRRVQEHKECSCRSCNE